ncbi:hypothetical protein K474DRAFT_298666 [Panus rudis PR-1116 ss-1]|nr:hypothetical protein K474DRAFT_298666 [Panus rudis PR-1116 ss-1]
MVVLPLSHVHITLFVCISLLCSPLVGGLCSSGFIFSPHLSLFSFLPLYPLSRLSSCSLVILYLSPFLSPPVQASRTPSLYMKYMTRENAKTYMTKLHIWLILLQWLVDRPPDFC